MCAFHRRNRSLDLEALRLFGDHRESSSLKCRPHFFDVGGSRSELLFEARRPTSPPGTRSTSGPRLPGFTEAKFGIFIHWGVYSVPAYAPVIPGKLAYAEWYWHQMTEGRDNPKANPIETGTWAYHQKVYGADYAYQNFAPQFRAQLFDPDQWAATFAARAPNMWC
jgi:hypothetical protein